MQPLPNSAATGDNGADAMVSVIAHEFMEATTDPQLNAWWSNYNGYCWSGMENGDLCAWNFGTVQKNSAGNPYNIVINSKQYLIQQIWINTQAMSVTKRLSSTHGMCGMGVTSKNVAYASYTASYGA